jgi:hypothetical protein
VIFLALIHQFSNTKYEQTVANPTIDPKRVISLALIHQLSNTKY